MRKGVESIDIRQEISPSTSGHSILLCPQLPTYLLRSMKGQSGSKAVVKQSKTIKDRGLGETYYVI